MALSHDAKKPQKHKGPRRNDVPLLAVQTDAAQLHQTTARSTRSFPSRRKATLRARTGATARRSMRRHNVVRQSEVQFALMAADVKADFLRAVIHSGQNQRSMGCKICDSSPRNVKSGWTL